MSQMFGAPPPAAAALDGSGADTYIALWSDADTITGHNAFTFNRSLTAIGIGGTASADIKCFMWGNVNLSGAAQFGFYSRPQFQSSATSSGTVYMGEIYTAGGFTMDVGTCFGTGTNNLSGSTLNLFRSFSAKPQTSGSTGNVCFTDDRTDIVGNWFIYGGSALPSRFSSSVVFAGAALATNATDGFIYLPTCAGTPTGVPTSYTGTAAFIYDTSNDKLYVYRSGWKATAALA